MMDNCYTDNITLWVPVSPRGASFLFQMIQTFCVGEVSGQYHGMSKLSVDQLDDVDPSDSTFPEFPSMELANIHNKELLTLKWTKACKAKKKPFRKTNQRMLASDIWSAKMSKYDGESELNKLQSLLAPTSKQ